MIMEQHSIEQHLAAQTKICQERMLTDENKDYHEISLQHNSVTTTSSVYSVVELPQQQSGFCGQYLPQETCNLQKPLVYGADHFTKFHYTSLKKYSGIEEPVSAMAVDMSNRAVSAYSNTPDQRDSGDATAAISELSQISSVTENNQSNQVPQQYFLENNNFKDKSCGKTDNNDSAHQHHSSTKETIDIRQDNEVCTAINLAMHDEDTSKIVPKSRESQLAAPGILNDKHQPFESCSCNEYKTKGSSYMCGGCDESFTTVCLLHCHMKTHSKAYYMCCSSKIAFPRFGTITKDTQTGKGSGKNNFTKLNAKSRTKNAHMGDNPMNEQNEKNNHIIKPVVLNSSATDKIESVNIIHIQKEFLRASKKIQKAEIKEDGPDTSSCENKHEYFNSDFDKNKSSDTDEYTPVEDENFGKKKKRQKRKNGNPVEKSAKKLKKKNETSTEKKVKHSKSKTSQLDKEAIASQKAGLHESIKRYSDDNDTEIILEPSKPKKRDLDKTKQDKTVTKKSGTTSKVKINSSEKNTIKSQEKVCCHLCDITFPKRLNLRIHIRTNHPDLPYICTLCSENFLSEQDLMDHRKKVHHRNDHQCELCGKVLSTKGMLEGHYLVHKGLKPFACSICVPKREFTRKSQLKSHMETHSEEKNLQCEFCGKPFNARYLMMNHVKHCSGNRPYKCRYCDMGFVSNHFLQRHLRTHTGEKPFVCEVCAFASSNASCLARHMRVHTGEKPFICKYCQQAFAAPGALKKHVRIHTQEKPYKCSYCTKSFTQRWNLKTHERQHTGETPYKCQVCGMGYKQNVLLKTHMKTHFGARPEQPQHDQSTVNQPVNQSDISSLSLMTAQSTLVTQSVIPVQSNNLLLDSKTAAGSLSSLVPGQTAVTEYQHPSTIHNHMLLNLSGITNSMFSSVS